MENLPKYISVSGTKFIRDTETGAILNTDKSEYNNYLVQRQIKLKEAQEKEMTQQKISQIEFDIQEIKSMIINLSKERLTYGN